MVSGIECGTQTVPPDRQRQFADVLQVEPYEFAKKILRYQDPWTYAILFGFEGEPELRVEIASAPERLNIRRGPRIKREMATAH